MKRATKDSLPTGVCVKVKHLRPRYDNLEEWLTCDTHCLVTRRGRVFIGSGDSRRVFHYSASEWANPFPVKQHGLEASLELYEEHLEKLLKEEERMERFRKLTEMTEIGCFCDPEALCHRDIILAKLKEVVGREEPSPVTKKVKELEDRLSTLQHEIASSFGEQ